MTPQQIGSMVEADPTVQNFEAEEQEALKDRDRANAQLAADSGNFDPEGALGKEPTFTANVPQDHFQDVMKQAPLLMALGAVGGLFGRAHGVAMLQTTNAMMKGVVQGNADAYSEARQKYDQQMEDFKAKQKTWVEVYKAYAAAYKGRIDADLRAQQGANAAVGIIGRQTELTKKQIGDTIKLSEQLKTGDARIDRYSHQDVTDALRAQNDKEKADAAASRAANAAAASGKKADDKAKTQAQSSAMVLQQIDELNDLLDKNRGLTGVAGAARRGLEWVDSSVDASAPLPATQFKSKMDTMLTNVYQMVKSKGNRLGLDERKKIEDAVEGVKMTSGAQQKVKLAELKEMVTGMSAPEQGALPILTPEQARSYPKGTQFMGTNGTKYTVQ